jgi:tetratricopeptide (TPR) repeat protein
MYNTASSSWNSIRYPEAVDLQEAEETLANRRLDLPADHPDIASALNRTASIYYALGRHAEALNLLEETLAFQRRVLPADEIDHLNIAVTIANMASICYALGRYAKALDLHEQTLAFQRRVLPADHPDIAATMGHIADSFCALGRREEAVYLYEQTLAFQQRILPADHPGIAQTMNYMARNYNALCRHAEALDLQKNALAFQRRVLPTDHPDIADTMSLAATSHMLLGHYAEALDLFEQTLAFQRRMLPADHPDIGSSLLNVGYALFPSRCGFNLFAHEALAILRLNLSESHHEVQKALRFIDYTSSILGAEATQRMHPPPVSSHHLRIGCLVRLHGLSTHALNGRQALVFGPEQNGRVAVRLVEESTEVRAVLCWAKGQEKAIKVENLQAAGLAASANRDSF